MVGEWRKGAFCLGVGGLRVQKKEADQKRGGKDRRTEETAQAKARGQKVWENAGIE